MLHPPDIAQSGARGMEQSILVTKTTAVIYLSAIRGVGVGADGLRGLSEEIFYNARQTKLMG